MKIFCHIPREDWFCDRYGKEYTQFSSHIVTHNDLENADVIWLLAAWCWNQIPAKYLNEKTVVCTIHHEVPWKFNEQRLHNFKSRDFFVDIYHVPCKQTKDFISKFTDKPIEVIGYWCNNHLWKESGEEKQDLKSKFNLPTDKLIVSSFQRDTEGSDLKTPKLEKGPDIFCKAISELSKKVDVHVLLNGWRRQFVMNELDKISVPYTYYELPQIEDVVRMYLATDLYIVGSRVEGGPQSLLECAITRTPILTTDVGMAQDIVSQKCITSDFNSILNLVETAPSEVEVNYNNVQEFLIEKHVKKYDELFKKLLEV